MGRSNTCEPQYEREGRGEEGEELERGMLEFVWYIQKYNLFCDKMVKTLQSVSSERGREVVI